MNTSQSPVLNTRQLFVEDLVGLNISKEEYTNLSNSTINRNQKHFLVKECNCSMDNIIFYHNPEFLKLTKEQKLKLIEEHHKKIADANYENSSRRLVFKYGKPIIPRNGIPFNGSLDVNWKPEDCNEKQAKNKTFDDLMGFKHQSFFKSDDLEHGCFVSSSPTTTRPRRHGKHQTYTEFLDSNDDESTDDIDKPLPLKKKKNYYFKSSDEDIKDEDIKSLQRSRKITSKPPTSLSNFCDRTNEIFDNLKKQDTEKDNINTTNSGLQKCVNNSGSSDSELDEHQKYNVSATARQQKSPALTNPKLTLKSTNLFFSAPRRTRLYNNKYSSVAKAVASTSKQIKNSSITASNLYEERTSHTLTKHNNNKTNKCEDTIVCPICIQSFPKTEIEDHAAKCEQFHSPSSRICEICNKSFSKKEISTHRINCIWQLTE